MQIALPIATAAYLLLVLGIPSLNTIFRHGDWPLGQRRGDDPVQQLMEAMLFLLLAAVAAWAALLYGLGPGPLGIWPVHEGVTASGWMVMGLGAAISLAAQLQMGQWWRIGIDERPSELITGGPFGLSRNPIFSGMILSLVGLALLTPSPWTVMGVLWAISLLSLQVRLEEKHLLAKHGLAYAGYAARVGRFVPGLGRLPLRDGEEPIGEPPPSPTAAHGDRPMPDLAFRGMAAIFALRDRLSPPERMVEEADLSLGAAVLDYGCGPGSHTLAAARIVGPEGQVHALDVQPLAIRQVRRRAAAAGLEQVHPILSNEGTGLDDGALDAVLLFDIFHMLGRPDGVLAELHRVLRPGGTLSFSDHHMKHEAIVSGVTSGGLFRLAERRPRTYLFERVD